MKSPVTFALLVVVVSFMTSLHVDAGTVHLYVSPSGSDANSGTSPSHPIRTLQHAVEMLQNSGVSGNNVFVELMQGDHVLTSTLHLSHDIHGSVTFRAYRGQDVHVIGGPRVPSKNFHHVTDSHALKLLPAPSVSKVLEVNLTQMGITDLGQIRRTSFNHKTPASLEVSVNGSPFRLARWPNQGYTNIKSTPDGNKGKRITYNVTDNRDAKWAQETEPWSYGWWCRGWADATLDIQDVDPHTHTITLAALENHGVCIGHYGDPNTFDQGGYFRVINMLSELDTPGEYYVDRNSKKLYLWPNTPQQTLTSSDRVYVSLLDDCIRIESNVRNVHFEGFTLELCRYYGFNLVNGNKVTFRNLEIKNIGSYAINCETDCRSVTLMESEIHDTTGGIWIGGGDRMTLTSSDNVIRDNHIHDYSRLTGNVGDAVRISTGVNTKVLYNNIHNGAYTGIRFSGNDHVIQYNHVHHVCQDSSDCGAIHSHGYYTYRGNVIEKNYVHHVLHSVPGPDNRGVMLDDEMSSVTARYNVFYDNTCHLNIAGGRDNNVEYNIFYNATRHSFQTDWRGKKHPEHVVSWTRELNTLPYKTGIWAQKYPTLVHILENNPRDPVGNVLANNIYFNQPHKAWLYCWDHVCDRKDWIDLHDNYQVNSPSDFVDPSNANFRPASSGMKQWSAEHHFPLPVLMSEVGPQVDVGPHHLIARRTDPLVR